MSDPVTNVEIEDVLSSIRRLVSEGDKAKRAEPRAVSDKPVVPEKLMLTPALRVAVEPTDSMELDTEAATIADEPDDSAIDDGAEIDVADITGDAPLAFVLADPVVDDSAEVDETDVPDIDPDDVPFDRAQLEQEHVKFNRANLEATIAELEAAVTDQPDEWEPDGSETDTAPTWAAAGFPSDQPIEDAEEITPDTAEVAEEVTPETASDDVESPLSFRHAIDDSNDSDDDHGDDLRDGDETAQDDDLAAYLADDTVIDEAMLRQLVLDIVRSELQGKLGERITRNVRKLVRREIHRVLTSQDLD